MSTFDGKVVECPDIRIDYFRPDPDARPPLAYFLSHVHSDHLIGLESCKSPFIYCSPATRDILLRLEKYPHRMNFAKGILETRKQTYRHLKNLLKSIPLGTPTLIELSPGNVIRVTLFDANHCVGAVMFLIEGGGKTILYTGDIRSERWWVDALTRHPVLIPYVESEAHDRLRVLDCIYLDTTFVVTGSEDAHRRFPSKADGLAELLRKASLYPEDTMFYIDAWTFGYEDVWQALSTSLESRIHVDDYRYGLYHALINGVEPKAPEAVKLTGFRFGNHFQQGCLSSSQCRLHSCEKGTGCQIWEQDFVRITPIVTRYNGIELSELGAGGGQGDLAQQHELEVWDSAVVAQLMGLCATQLQDQKQLLTKVLEVLASAMKEGSSVLELEDFKSMLQAEECRADVEGYDGSDEVRLEDLVSVLARIVNKPTLKQSNTSEQRNMKSAQCVKLRPDGLPTQITFPYSRHSSYEELCVFIDALKPRDIVPCTVDDKKWTVECSMNFLFGHLYSDTPRFRHDKAMARQRNVPTPSQSRSTRRGFSVHETGLVQLCSQKHRHRPRRNRSPPRSIVPSSNGRFDERPGRRWHRLPPFAQSSTSPLRDHDERHIGDSRTEVERSDGIPEIAKQSIELVSRRTESLPLREMAMEDVEVPRTTSPTRMQPALGSSAFRMEAYQAIKHENSLTWSDIGLVSVGGHQVQEEEL